MTRSNLIKKVHVGKRELGLDDETYRGLLERVTGHRSAADCNDKQLALVVDEMKAKGFHVKQKKKYPAQLPKMRALWITLWCLRVVRNPQDRALLAFTARQTGKPVGDLSWVTPDDANKVIEALKDMCAKAGFDVPSNGHDAKHHLAIWLAQELRDEGYDTPPTRDELNQMTDKELDAASVNMRQLLGDGPAGPAGEDHAE
ncbi:hypothetical protein BN1012_Phect2616 [Candidatus Phaeomarinobacter ectocarpi]|uniref:Mu-like prophage protein gp16 n=1 Tax=Candidatus Phaeomarinibacter ectocarpi TaxID=1458461 RepID=X5MGX9_9HYPH|nr:regulatory protein GemA [Candidatus Phaeomarinobacter ectocarpi]CDO60829.1 hypothetical protein BN1012_Phect2616 [Candidatus Phaeomarinobacter ectocarpi]